MAGVVSGTAMTSAESEVSGMTARAGGCLCGAVRFLLRGPLRDVVNCHCSQCRRTHGHFGAYTSLGLEGLELLEQRGLKWYQSSALARRGFCGECGASLFWQERGSEHIEVAAGTLDAPTGLRTCCHIHTASAGDYYSLDDELPHLPEGLGAG